MPQDTPRNTPHDYLRAMSLMIEGRMTPRVSSETEITGAQWRLFYCNHFPKECYIDDIGVDFEDERGKFILPDDARHRLRDFGYFGWQSMTQPDPDIFADHTLMPIHLLYNAVMHGNDDSDAVVSFRIPKDKAEALISAAEAIGGTLV